MEGLIFKVKIKVKEEKVKLKEYDFKIYDKKLVDEFKGRDYAYLLLSDEKIEAYEINEHKKDLLKKVLKDKHSHAHLYLLKEDKKVIRKANLVENNHKGCPLCDSTGHCSRKCKI